jgi:hypothetical protein
VEVPAQLDWLLFGGGSEPLTNQVSLAQDLGHLHGLLEGHGLTLFASGPNAPLAVEQPHAKAPQAPDLNRELARFFGVPFADGTRYEPAKLDVDGPATGEQVLHALDRGLERGRGPLFVYAASHGDQGERPSENALSMWGGWSLKVGDVAAMLDRHDQSPRGTRFVITACFGGGFADLAFVGADPKRGPRSPEHCGLFAAPWDDEASGCDPNPDRRAQESYSIHFLHALKGENRRAEPRLSEIDLNADGQVSLLEAHTYARIAGRSFDTPTTTSERFLREVASLSKPSEQSAGAGARAKTGRSAGGETAKDAPLDPLSAPEEVSVVRALGEELELSRPQEARAKLAELDGILSEATEEVSKAQKLADDAYYALRISLLERFPLLEHPWEPRTRELLDQQGAEILKLLTESDLAAEQTHAAMELDQALADQDSVRVERARVLRLVRAFETLQLASALRIKGGAHYTHYEALRRCENWVPRLRSNAHP